MTPATVAAPPKLPPPSAEEVRREIQAECCRVSAQLVKKNNAYGNSALDPVRIFSRARADEQLLVRIDDKISRIARGSEFPGDDTVDDLVGYLILLKVWRRLCTPSALEAALTPSPRVSSL